VTRLAAIFGLQGPALRAEERAFFRDSDPAGFILFGRNIVDPDQLRGLTDDLRALSGRDLPILVDQEGGRVARLGPPHWPQFPPAEAFARLYRTAPMSAIEAARANAEAMAILLAEAGLNVNCAPMLDVRDSEAHDVVGDRALGSEPMQVAALGRAILDGLAAGGVAGVIKHMPGHGRVRVDSHETLPVVEAGREELARDFAPFRALNRAHFGMTAHIVYTALDPDRPASLSPTVIADIIRGEIGFDGLLLSDDICMGALSGGIAERSAAAVAAGNDLVLHCSGDLAEMIDVAAAAGPLSASAEVRLEKALAAVPARASGSSWEALVAKRDSLLAFA
jgi:beta-N-acetylhexosaminidase